MLCSKFTSRTRFRYVVFYLDGRDSVSPYCSKTRDMSVQGEGKVTEVNDSVHVLYGEASKVKVTQL